MTQPQKSYGYATCNLFDKQRLQMLLANGCEPFAISKYWFKTLIHLRKENSVKNDQH